MAQAKQDKIAALYADLKARQFAAAPEVTVEELQAWQREGKELVLCDVRTQEEHAVSTLPGARTRADVEAHRAQLKASKVPVLCFCTIGARSGVAVLALRRDGVEAFNLKGSILSWTHAGGPLVEPDGKATRRVHVYSPAWSLEAEAYSPVTFQKPPLGKVLFTFLRDKSRALFGV